MDNEKSEHVPQPTFVIDHAVIFNDPEDRTVVIMGKVTGARFKGGEWNYTVYCESSKEEPDTYEVAEPELVFLRSANQ